MEKKYKKEERGKKRKDEGLVRRGRGEREGEKRKKEKGGKGKG